MISLLIDAIRLNFRGAAVIVDEGHLLLHRAEGDAFWVLPGGRVEADEASHDAVVRELREETGSHIECLGLAFPSKTFLGMKACPAMKSACTGGRPCLWLPRCGIKTKATPGMSLVCDLNTAGLDWTS